MAFLRPCSMCEKRENNMRADVKINGVLFCFECALIRSEKEIDQLKERIKELESDINEMRSFQN